MILGPILLHISGNLDTDLAKLGRTRDRTGLPFTGCDQLGKWTDRNLLKFDEGKCKVFHPPTMGIALSLPCCMGLTAVWQKRSQGSW